MPIWRTSTLLCLLCAFSVLSAIASEDSGTTLQGGANFKQDSSPLNIQHFGSPGSVPQVMSYPAAAPSPMLGRQLDAEISRSKLLQGVSRNIAPSLQAELSNIARPPFISPILPVIPPTPHYVPAMPSGSLGVGMPSNERLREASKELEHELHGWNYYPTSRLDLAPMAPVPSLTIDRPIPSISSIPSEFQVDPRINSALLAAERDLNAELLRAKKSIDGDLSIPRSSLNVTLAPPLVSESVAGQVMMRDTVGWNDWHRRFAMLLKPALLDAMRRHDYPSGTNVLAVTVCRDCRLRVSIYRPSNPNYDDAILDAYRSLSGNLGLTFPAGTTCAEVSFHSRSSHESGVVSDLFVRLPAD
ncbi:MAG: hypothetical protein AB7W16_24180 [Candidatus Obscuribacterales bacterium]